MIAGFYIDANNVAHGFVTAAPFKTFTILNDPDAGQGAGQGTFAGNINLGGEIAGYYVDASGVSHGFVTAPPYRTFTSFDPAGSVYTLAAVASALNLEGAVTGTYFDASGVASRLRARCERHHHRIQRQRAQARAPARAPKAQASATWGRPRETTLIRAA